MFCSLSIYLAIRLWLWTSCDAYKIEEQHHSQTLTDDCFQSYSICLNVRWFFAIFLLCCCSSCCLYSVLIWGHLLPSGYYFTLCNFLNFHNNKGVVNDIKIDRGRRWKESEVERFTGKQSVAIILADYTQL